MNECKKKVKWNSINKRYSKEKKTQNVINSRDIDRNREGNGDEEKDEKNNKRELNKG